MQQTLLFILGMLLVGLALSGCNTLVEKAVDAMPTVAHCDRVEYIREGSSVTIDLQCRMPRGSTGLPLGF